MYFINWVTSSEVILKSVEDAQRRKQETAEEVRQLQIGVQLSFNSPTEVLGICGHKRT